MFNSFTYNLFLISKLYIHKETVLKVLFKMATYGTHCTTLIKSVHLS